MLQVQYCLRSTEAKPATFLFLVIYVQVEKNLTHVLLWMDCLDLLYLKIESSKINVSFVSFYLEMMHSKVYGMIH